MVSAPPGRFAFPLFTWSNDARVRIHRRANRKGGRYGLQQSKPIYPETEQESQLRLQRRERQYERWVENKRLQQPNKSLEVPRSNKHKAKCDVFLCHNDGLKTQLSPLWLNFSLNVTLLCGRMSICVYCIQYISHLHLGTQIHPQRETQDVGIVHWNMAGRQLKF